ncbi:MAG TPA: autotransporter-associated beta strand repeat-containing protein, partial [Verrucomicrobiae bacterium]
MHGISNRSRTKTTLLTAAGLARPAVRLSCLLLSLLAAGIGQAADVSLKQSDASGTTSWNAALNWTDATAPSAGNNYFTAGFTLRTPTSGANTTFNGGSLTVNGGQVLYKCSGSRTITINNLTLDNGGAIANGNGNTTCTLAGNGITVNTTGSFTSTTDSSDRTVVVNPPISGAGTITCAGNGVVLLANTASPFTGKWLLRNNQTRANVDTSFGSVPADYVADTITLDGGILMNNSADLTISANRGIAVTSAGGRLQAGWSRPLTINSIVSGGGGLTLVGDATPGIITLNGANTYTGATVVQNNAWLQVSGSIDAASAVTVQAGGVLMGAGSINGQLTVNGTITGGGLFAAGTLTVNNAATLDGCTLLVDLSDKTDGANDLVVVNGDLRLNGTVMVSVNPLTGTLTPGTYRLINYTGTLTGSAATLVAAPSGYNITFDTSTAGQVNMTVLEGGAPASLVWKGDNVLNLWDLSTASWLSGGNAATFRNGDDVLIDDSGANALPVTISSPGLVNAVVPHSVTIDITKNYTLTGGRMAGPMSLTKKGTGTFFLTGANGNLPNFFDGPVVIEAGLVWLGYGRALGSTVSGTTVRNGATLDINGQDLGFEALTVEGEGVGGAGVLINTGGGQNNALRIVTMTGNTTVGGTGRFDIRNIGGDAFLNTGGNGYKLTKKGPNQFSLVGVAVDSALGDVDVQEGTFGFETTSTLGDATKTMSLAANTSLRLWNLASTNAFYKPLVLGGGTANNIDNGSGTNTITAPVTLTAQSTWNIAGTSLAVYSGIGGAGGLTKAGSAPLYLYGTNSYSGPTLVSGGKLVLDANASISNSPAITLSSGTTLDVSAISTASGAFVLNSAIGQTLGGSGTVTGNVALAAGSTVIPGTSAGTLTCNGDLKLDGATAVIELGATTNVGGGVNDLIVVNGNLTLGGTLTIKINALAPLDTVNPYTIATYTGALDISTVNPTVVSDSRYTFTLDPAGAPGTIRVIAAPVGTGAETLTWQGNVAGSETLWDIKTTANWSNSLMLADSFFLGDRVIFDDTAVGTTVSLAGAVTPGALTVTNETKDFVWTGAGKLSGPTAIVKQGAGKLTIANDGVNDNAGTTTISAGKLQVGNGGTVGNLNSAAITDNGTLTFNRSDNITINNVISGSGQLEKEGSGLMVLSQAQSALTGPIVVKAGTLRTGNAASLGTTAAGTTIADGATLDVNAQTLGNEAITVSGSGVGGAGAIYNSAGEQQNATRNVILAGDTTFGGIGRWDIRSNNVPSGLTGNGYKLTKVGNNAVWLVSLGETGLGDVVINGGTLGFEVTTTMGDPAKAIAVNPGASVGMYNNNNSAAPLMKIMTMNTAGWA